MVVEEEVVVVAVLVDASLVDFLVENRNDVEEVVVEQRVDVRMAWVLVVVAEVEAVVVEVHSSYCYSVVLVATMVDDEDVDENEDDVVEVAAVLLVADDWAVDA